MPTLLAATSLLLLAFALWLILRSATARRRSGLPKGRLVYADTGNWSAVSRPYFSSRHGLTGKPDYLVETAEGLVPIEVKRTAVPADGQPYASHLMQLAGYCLLIEEAHGQAPAYGLVHYANATVQVEYTAELRSALLVVLADMRRARAARIVRRSHQEPARCQSCGLRDACGRQALR